MSKSFYMINQNTCTRVKLYGIDVKNLFLINGYVEDNKEKSNYIIINTCSFLKTKEEYFMNYIKRLSDDLASYQKLIVIGCLPSIRKNDLLKMNDKIITFGRDIDAIKDYFNFSKNIKSKATTVCDKLPLKKELLYQLNKFIFKSKHIEYRLKRDKVCYLQISSGCRGKCAYCSEKFTTKLKSRPIKEILLAINDGIERGYKLFGLNSDDASAYGKDIDSSLEELLSEVVKIKSDVSFSIPEFNPNGLTEKVIEYLKDKKFIYITVPIQSGSQDILNKMKRPYQIDEVIEKVRRIKQNNKKIKINTHVIVGFPGETEEDFNKTLDVIKLGLFDRVKVFMYNDRPNTIASTMTNKISDAEKKRRREILLKEMKKQNIKHFSITNIILNKEQIV
ncbi:MAG: radical SAM protein [Bacilli bacterium]|nr:radical SAM protein [Bacilli bacterium]